MTRILVVDDEKPVRAVLGQILERHGYAVTLAADAMEARAHLAMQPFDLILSDIMMPHESGIDLVRFVMAEFKETAVIMITGIDDPYLASMVIDEGAFDYIVKPIRKNRVLVSVANALHRRELQIANRSSRLDQERAIQERTASLQRTIHQLEEAQSALRESETRYRELVENANSVILRVDPEGFIRFANQYAYTFFRYEPGDLVGRRLIDTIVPDTDDQGRDLSAMVKNVMTRPEDYRFNENQNVCSDGRVVWVTWTNRAIYDEEGRLKEILSIGSDVTRRKKTEEKSRLLAAALEQADEGVCITDTAGIIHYVNPALERFSRYEADELIGKNARIFKSGMHDAAFYREMWAHLGEGRVFKRRITNRKKDGELYTVMASFAPIKDRWKRITHYVCIQRCVE